MVDGKASSTSKSTISRRFVEGTGKKLAELLGRRLDDRRYPALMIDGVVMADHTVVVALGVDEEGKKHILGLWEGATENAPVCKSLLMDLVDRDFQQTVDPGHH